MTGNPFVRFFSNVKNLALVAGGLLLVVFGVSKIPQSSHQSYLSMADSKDVAHADAPPGDGDSDGDQPPGDGSTWSGAAGDGDGDGC